MRNRRFLRDINDTGYNYSSEIQVPTFEGEDGSESNRKYRRRQLRWNIGVTFRSLENGLKAKGHYELEAVKPYEKRLTELYNDWQDFLALLIIYLPTTSTIRKQPPNRLRQLLGNLSFSKPKHQYEALRDWWSNKSSVNKRYTRIHDALRTLNQLSSTPNSANRKAIADALLSYIDIELRTLQLKATRKIEKDQHYPQEGRKELLRELVARKQVFNANIKEHKYSQYFKPGSDGYKVFSERERFRFKYKEYTHHAEKAGSVTKVATAVNDLLGVLRAIPGLLKIGQALGTVLSGIPLVNAIVAALPALFSAARAWLRNKSAWQKAAATALAVVIVGAIITAGLVPPATLFIGFGLLVLGTVVQYVLPWLKLRNKIAVREKLLENLEERKKHLENTGRKDFVLAPHEKTAVHRLLSHYWRKQVANNRTSKKALQALLDLKRDVNTSMTLEQLEKHPIIRKALAAEGKHGSLTQYLIADNAEAQRRNQAELADLRAKYIASTAKLVNSVFTVIGAAMLFVPFPPVQIAGAALLITTAVIGLALKFEVPQKIWHFFTKKSDKPKPVTQGEHAEHRKDLQEAPAPTVAPKAVAPEAVVKVAPKALTKPKPPVKPKKVVISVKTTAKPEDVKNGYKSNHFFNKDDETLKTKKIQMPVPVIETPTRSKS